MKINFDIDINTEKEPQSPTASKQKDDYIYVFASVAVISHLLLLGLLFSSALFANNIMVDEGDDSIKAVMVDLTQNFDIDINTEKEPQSSAANKQKDDYIYVFASVAVISHLLLLGLLFSSALFANNIMIDEGDDSIKAVMVDLTQITYF